MEFYHYTLVLQGFPIVLSEQCLERAMRVMGRWHIVLFTNHVSLVVQWSPLVWSMDVRSTRLYGQFLASPERIGHFVSEKARFKV